MTATAVAQVRNSIARASGLRVNLDRLDDDEVAELRALVAEIARSTDESDVQRDYPGHLDAKGSNRWEMLVARAAGQPDNYFAKQAEQAAADKADDARARRPSRHPRLEEAGMIVLPPEIFRGLQDGGLGATHLLVLTLVLAMIENKAPAHPHARVEDGAVIVPSVEHLVAAIDLEGDVGGVARAVRELADASLLVVQRQGEVRISLGPMLANALKRRDAS